MKARHKRLVFVTIAIAGVAVAAALALSALQSNIAYFFSPTQVLNGEAPKDKVFRLGGMVADGSVQRKSGDLTMTFVVTDTAQNPIEGVEVAFQVTLGGGSLSSATARTNRRGRRRPPSPAARAPAPRRWRRRPRRSPSPRSPSRRPRSPRGRRTTCSSRPSRPLSSRPGPPSPSTLATSSMPT